MRKIFLASAALLLLAAAGSALAIDWPVADQSSEAVEVIECPLTGEMIDADCCPVGDVQSENCDWSHGSGGGDCPHAGSKPECDTTDSSAHSAAPSHCSGGGGVCPFSGSKSETSEATTDR